VICCELNGGGPGGDVKVALLKRRVASSIVGLEAKGARFFFCYKYLMHLRHYLSDDGS